MSKDRICAVIGCNKINYYIYKDPEGDNVRFFRFPKNDKKLCMRWISQLHRYDLIPIFREKPNELWRNYRVCSEHFLKSDLIDQTINKNKKKRRLISSAVPVLNLGDQNEIYLAGTPSDITSIIKNENEESASLNTEMMVEVESQSQHSKNSEVKAKIQELDHLIFKNKEQMLLLQEQIENFSKFKDCYMDFHKKRKEGKKCVKNCTSCQKHFALELYMKSPYIYKYLQEKFTLPDPTVLYRWKRNNKL